MCSSYTTSETCSIKKLNFASFFFVTIIIPCFSSSSISTVVEMISRQIYRSRYYFRSFEFRSLQHFELQSRPQFICNKNSSTREIFFELLFSSIFRWTCLLFFPTIFTFSQRPTPALRRFRPRDF